MAESEKEKPLTEKEKDAIRSAINAKTEPDDRDPREVIKEDFAGDEEAYLGVMAKFHNIPIGSASPSD